MKDVYNGKDIYNNIYIYVYNLTSLTSNLRL